MFKLQEKKQYDFISLGSGKLTFNFAAKKCDFYFRPILKHVKLLELWKVQVFFLPNYPYKHVRCSIVESKANERHSLDYIYQRKLQTVILV